MRAHTRIVPLLLGLAVIGCTNPIDAGLGYVFEGLFESLDGTVIELDGEQGVVVATGKYGVPAMGTVYIRNATPAGDVYMAGVETRDYDVDVRYGDGQMKPALVKISDDGMWIERSPMEYTQDVWSRIESIPDPDPAPTTPGGGGSGPGNGGGTAGTIVLLNRTGLSGSRSSSQYFTVTVPSGTKKLSVQTLADDQWGRPYNDLFVSQGTQPRVTSREPYQWSARCASVKPNFEDEICVFDNPASGTWHILLYGYHEYYGTTLKVTVDK